MRQESLFGSDVEQEEALLSHLLQRARLYNESESYKGLLEFVGRLPHLAPFNALLVNIQKPGLRFAAFEHEWSARFKRTIKEGARPLVVLWPFAPVAFVYDVADTEGEPLPEAVECAFRATGSITHGRIKEFSSRLAKMGIYVYRVEYGDGLAGSIGFDRVAAVRQSILAKTRPDYRLCLNARHDPNVQFATIVHELGHLFLGHLGQDAYLKIPGRSYLERRERELEAEAVSYLVCHRAGVDSDADRYLANFVDNDTPIHRLDAAVLMRAAGHIEMALGIAVRSRPSAGSCDGYPTPM